MTTWNAAAQTALADGTDIEARWLLWVEARNRSTAAIETIGVWSGIDDQNFSPTGVSRLYYGRQGLFEVQPITAEAGTSIQSVTINLPGISPEMEQMIRGYDTRTARAQLHLMLTRASDLALLDYGQMFDGIIDRAIIQHAGEGGGATSELTLISNAALGTRKPGATKSDLRQRIRGDDRGRRYADVTGLVDDWWGDERG